MEPFIVAKKDRVRVMLFGQYCIVRVARVFSDTVYQDSEKPPEIEPLFETKSGLVFSCLGGVGNLMSWRGAGGNYERSGAPKCWLDRVIAPSERATELWALGEK